MTRQQKTYVSIGLAAAWAGLLLFRFGTAEEPARLPLKYKSGPAAEGAAPAARGDVPTLAAHGRPVQSTEFTEPRNIFAMLHQAVDPAAVRVARKPQARVMTTKQHFGPPTPTADELAYEMDLRKKEEAARLAREREEEAVRLAREKEEALRRQQEAARLQREQMLAQSRQQMAQFRFMGYLKNGRDATAFLSRGKDIFLVRPGDTVDGQVQVLHVDAEQVKLIDGATKVEASLALVKEGAKADGK